MDDADLFADLEELGQDEESEQENDEMAEDNDEMKESIASFSKTFNSQQLAQLLKVIAVDVAN
jgi:hypothetical protein